MSLAHSWSAGGSNGYGTPASARALDELVAIGIRGVTVATFAFMDDVQDSGVRVQDLPGTETEESARAVARQARERGLTVMLKPQVYLLNGEWCGDIAPRDGWQAWFASYRRFILANARMAAEADIETLIVGVELKTSTRFAPEAWRSLIAEVRRVYPGTVVYSANWDEVEDVTFWPLVDAIGVSLYAPLEQSNWLLRYETVAAKADRPLIITETGFMNRIDARAIPYVWPEWVTDESPSFAGDMEQADGYRAIIDTFGRSPRVKGIYWWKWFTDVDANRDEGPLGFSPRGRFAESVLRQTCATSSPPRRPSSRTSRAAAR